MEHAVLFIQGGDLLQDGIVADVDFYRKFIGAIECIRDDWI
jgi:hypothetical protein